MANNKKGSEFDKVVENSILIQMKDNLKKNESLGVGQKYNRTLYDDINKRNKFKEDFFYGNRTEKDYITGETLHVNSKAAKSKYRKENYTKHIADVDHIIPEKQVHKKLKNNPYLSDEDVKEIANSKSNYRITSARLNRHKRHGSNLKVAFESKSKLKKARLNLNVNSRARLIGDQVRAEISLNINATLKTVNNMANDFSTGSVNSLEASAIAIMIEGVRNLYLVANGEKEFEEAAKDMGKLTSNIAFLGGGIQVMTTGINNTLRNNGNAALQRIVNSNQVTQVISIALILKDSLVRYINGDINGEEFFREIGERGVGIVSGTIGAVIGQAVVPIPFVGAFIGAVVISTVCIGIYKTCNVFMDSWKSIINSFDEHKEKLSRVNYIAFQALNEMERQRNILKDMIGKQFSQWGEQFNLAFEEIYSATMNDDINGISNGLDRMLNVFGESVKFKTFEEFDEFFMHENSIFTL